MADDIEVARDCLSCRHSLFEDGFSIGVCGEYGREATRPIMKADNCAGHETKDEWLNKPKCETCVFFEADRYPDHVTFEGKSYRGGQCVQIREWERRTGSKYHGSPTFVSIVHTCQKHREAERSPAAKEQDDG